MRLARVAVLCIGGVIAAGCFTAAQKDFDDYHQATESFRQPKEAGPVDAAGFDSAPPTEATDAIYAASCLSQLAGGRIDRVLRFYTKTSFTPDGTGGGKMTMSVQAFALGPKDENGRYTAPAAVSAANTVGDTYTVTDRPVDAKGVFDAPFGVVRIPGAANPISGRDIEIDDTDMPARFASPTFCSKLAGRVVDPLTVTLEPDSNTCVFKQAKEGDPYPDFTADDFANGCPLQ